MKYMSRYLLSVVKSNWSGKKNTCAQVLYRLDRQKNLLIVEFSFVVALKGFPFIYKKALGGFVSTSCGLV